jgi:hypothetical protein
MRARAYAITRLVSPTHRRFLLLEQGIGAAVFNLALNAAIAWLVFRRLETVPLRGEQSIAGDTLITGFLLPFFTCLIVTRLARKQVEAGHVPPLAWTGAGRVALGWLPARTWLRGVVLGGAGVVLLAMPVVALLDAAGVDGLTLGRFVAFKASFAALAALLVTPAIARWAIAPAVLGRGSAA